MKVVVVMGGPSQEHDISLQSGQMVASGLAERHQVWPLRIEKNRHWSFFLEALSHDPENTDFPFHKFSDPLDPGQGPAQLLKLAPDVVFIALHGAFGEDGKIQGMLEWLGLPYVGSGPQASALAMDKSRTKDVYRSNGLPTPDWLEVFADDWKDQTKHWIEETIQHLGFPLVAKAPNQGSSIGMDMVDDLSQLKIAMANLLPLEGRVLLERKVSGQELTCGVLDRLNKPPLALPPTLIRPKSSTYFDFEAKYQVGACEEITPAPLENEILEQLQKLSLTAHRILGCQGMSRTDALLLPDNSLTLLETNTIPGFTPTSLLPQGAQAAGFEFPDLLDLLLESALSRKF